MYEMWAKACSLIKKILGYKYLISNLIYTHFALNVAAMQILMSSTVIKKIIINC